MKANSVTTLKEFKVILYEQTVLHFTVRAADADDAHDIAHETYYGWSPAERAEYVSTAQGSVDLDIEEASNERDPPSPPA